MDNLELIEILEQTSVSSELKAVARKVLEGKRITPNEGFMLYKDADTGFLGALANYVRHSKNGKKTYFNRNFHIEPTNICIHNCTFCSFARKINEEGSWEYSIDDIEKTAENYKGKGITEVHIVGGVHPHRDLHYYGKMIQRIKKVLPNVHVKGFTAVELDFMILKAHLDIDEGLKLLKEYGLDSIPGGGAEIFAEEIRSQVCDTKASTNQWLTIHEKAHNVGLPSNATMLYGHIEKYEHRIDHLEQLRLLQDKTNGFNTFIPLKYRKENNNLSHIGEVSVIEDLRNYAVSRIYLDNFPHIKAYWPMIGKEITQTALSFGVDDVDGTIDDSTKIYSMAGAEDKTPSMSTSQLVDIIQTAGFVPIERDTLYNEQ